MPSAVLPVIAYMHKLSLAEVKKTYLILSYFMIMIDDKLYLSNSMAMHFLNEPLDKSSNYTHQ
jgi:hypothetical protein